MQRELADLQETSLVASACYGERPKCMSEQRLSLATALRDQSAALSAASLKFEPTPACGTGSGVQGHECIVSSSGNAQVEGCILQVVSKQSVALFTARLTFSGVWNIRICCMSPYENSNRLTKGTSWHLPTRVNLSSLWPFWGRVYPVNLCASFRQPP